MIKQNCGHLIIRRSQLKYAGVESAITFSGKSIFVKQTQLEDCKNGAICNSGNSRMNVKICRFVNCTAEHGGAIHSDSLEEVRISQCIFEKCRASFLGSAIYFSYKKYGQDVTDCVFEDCEPEDNIIYNMCML